jgi:hypothetical protein
MLALARTMQPGLHRRPDLHRLIHSNTSTTATNSRSRIRKPTIFAIRRLIDTPPLQPLRPNPHSARATAIRSPSRFRPLEAFGRRPPEYVAPRQRPASETLHISEPDCASQHARQCWFGRGATSNPDVYRDYVSDRVYAINNNAGCLSAGTIYCIAAKCVAIKDHIPSEGLRWRNSRLSTKRPGQRSLVQCVPGAPEKV